MPFFVVTYASQNSSMETGTALSSFNVFFHKQEENNQDKAILIFARENKAREVKLLR